MHDTPSDAPWRWIVATIGLAIALWAEDHLQRLEHPGA